MKSIWPMQEISAFDGLQDGSKQKCVAENNCNSENSNDVKTFLSEIIKN